MPMFKKLKIKFIITIMALLTSIVVLLFGTIYMTTRKNNEYMLFSQVTATLNDIKISNAGQITAHGRYVEDSILAEYNFIDNNIIYSTSINVDKEDIRELISRVFNDSKDKGFLKYSDNNYVYAFRKTPFGTDIVFQECNGYNSYLNKLIVEFIIIGVISLVILFALSVIIARKSIKPVEAAYNSQKRFIGDASHELKTPLAVIKTNIDVLKANENDTIKNQEKWFNYISFQTDRMSKLVSNLLYLARSDNNEVLGKESLFNVGDSIMNQILSFEAIAYENNLELKCDIDEKINFYGDKEAINQLIGILVDNAIKHSFKNTIVRVKLEEIKKRMCISVQNTGETIPKEDIDKIFERFYRVDKSRERERGGYGLGLSIAKSIVTRYKGKIYVQSENNLTKFSVELPIK